MRLLLFLVFCFSFPVYADFRGDLARVLTYIADPPTRLDRLKGFVVPNSTLVDHVLTSLVNSIAFSTFATDSDEGRINRTFLEFELADHSVGEALEISDAMNPRTQLALQSRLMTYLARFPAYDGRRTLATRLITQAGALPLSQNLSPQNSLLVSNLILEIFEKDLPLSKLQKRWRALKRCGSALIARSL